MSPWHEFLSTVPRLFDERGFTWVDTTSGAKLGCQPADFPDAFHSDARCSALLLRRLRRAGIDNRRLSLREIR
jgi:hypothetical protein